MCECTVCVHTVYDFVCVEESHSNSWHAQAPAQNVRNPRSFVRVCERASMSMVFICKLNKCVSLCVNYVPIHDVVGHKFES